MAVDTLTPASRAMQHIVDLLEAAGITATRDAGAFFPRPVGVLVALPSLTSRLLAARTFTMPVLIVSGNPLNSSRNVDLVYALADEVLAALPGEGTYFPSSWRSAPNVEPLPAVEITVTATVPEE